MKVILEDKFSTVKTLKQQTEDECLSLSLKCLKHPQLKWFPPLNEKAC